MAQLTFNRPIGVRLPRGQILVLGIAAFVAATGIVCLILSPIIGPAAFDSLWGVEPLGYIGAILLIIGLAAGALGLAVTAIRQAALAAAERDDRERFGEEQSEHWREVTLDFFSEFDHDLGRPLRRITGRQRELRAALRASGDEADPEVMELLDEIERQAVNYRLMLSNIQVLVQSEAPGEPLDMAPMEPAEVVRRIVDRYTPVALENGKEISWWAEPQDFGMVSSNSHAIEHIVANLIDNAVTHADSHVEVSLTRDDVAYYVKVWDDGPGIPTQYHEFLFDRGWTPEVGRREEKTSSGLGLFIASTLARNCRGALAVESIPEPQEGHYTSFLLTMPLKGR
jgi:signal transduction histidine kinase